MPADELAEAKKALSGREAAVKVFPDNWPVVEVFCAMETQWRYVALPTGHIRKTGLDYAALPPVLEALQPEIQGSELLAGLKTMDIAAREVMDKR